jgi:hypothetical protein
MITAPVYPSYASIPSPLPRPLSDEITLVALSSAERFAGFFARRAAVGWGFRLIADHAERVAIELITRAVETTGNPDPYVHYTKLTNPPPLTGIRVSHDGHGLLIAVWDSDPTPPQDAQLDNHLSTVAEISQQCGCYQPRGGGKVICAKLVIPPRHQPWQQSPQRTAVRYSPELETPIEHLRDVAIMQRVRDALHHQLNTTREQHCEQLLRGLTRTTPNDWQQRTRL